jgi:hypothetical protein
MMLSVICINAVVETTKFATVRATNGAKPRAAHLVLNTIAVTPIRAGK